MLSCCRDVSFTPPPPPPSPVNHISSTGDTQEDFLFFESYLTEILFHDKIRNTRCFRMSSLIKMQSKISTYRLPEFLNKLVQNFCYIYAVLRIRIRRINIFLGLLDPDPSIIMSKIVIKKP